MRFPSFDTKYQGSLVLCFCAFVLTGSGQIPPKQIREFTTEEVRKVSIDRLGNFYLVLMNGSIKKYDTLGNYMSTFAGPGVGALTILEPWNPLRVFIYSQKNQEILLLDHSLELEQKIAVDPAWAIEPILSCPAILTNFWVMDKADLSLKMIDSKTKAVVREIYLRIPADENQEFGYLREYQNLIFLIDKKFGIYVLNTLGLLVHKIPAKNLEYVGFLGEEFYYLEDHQLKFYDLYTDERHEVSVDPMARFVLVTDEQMVMVKKNTVEVLEFRR